MSIITRALRLVCNQLLCQKISECLKDDADMPEAHRCKTEGPPTDQIYDNLRIKIMRVLNYNSVNKIEIHHSLYPYINR